MEWINDNILNRIPNVCENSNCNGIYLIYFYVLLAGAIYFSIVSLFFKGFNHRDYLNTIIYSDKCLGKVSWWPVTHFVLYFILGLLFPDCDLIIIIVSFLWEAFEEFLGRFLYDNDIKMPFQDGTYEVQYKRWWRGSWFDILYNLSGYYSAKALVKLFGWDIKIPGINTFE